MLGISSIKCEIAVIGSGPGGAITACLLAEAGRDVLLIEEGANLPLESCAPFSLEEMSQKYRNGGLTAAFGKPKIQYVEGRCVGGGSEINSGLYHRTPPEILEKWQKDFDVKNLTEKDLLSHFEACEQAVNVCFLPGKPPAASLKLHEGAARLGWQSLEVPRWFRYEENTGTKQSMTKTFIPRALKSGCKLLAETRIKTLHQNGKNWILKGNCQSPLSEIEIQAETVFVCCGAIQTPALLRRSGIKNNIGNSLQMHPTVKIIAQFDEEVNNINMGVPVHQVKEFSPRFSFGCSISSPPYLAVAMTDHPNFTQDVKNNWKNMAIYYAMITGEGSGTVRNLPFYCDPLVQYRLTPKDLKDLSEGLQKLSQLLFESKAKILYPSLSNYSPLTHPQDIQKIPEKLPPSQTNLMTVHVFSSCPMGENLQKCAVDSFGKVHGYDNLYIADGSLLCTAPGVNPQGSIMAIAYRNALQFLSL